MKTTTVGPNAVKRCHTDDPNGTNNLNYLALVQTMATCGSPLHGHTFRSQHSRSATFPEDRLRHKFKLCGLIPLKHALNPDRRPTHDARIAPVADFPPSKIILSLFLVKCECNYSCSGM